MEFEFDPAKSAANKAKHGIDFEEAQELWKDPDRALAPALAAPERRLVAIGKIGDKVWTAIFTMARRSGPDHFGSSRAQGRGRAL